LGFSRAGLDSHVNLGLGFVAVGTEKSEVGFSILPAIDKRNSVVNLSAVSDS
jgi:hypothetical protein